MKTIYKIAALSLIISLSACKNDEASSRDQKIEQLTDVIWGSPTVTHADGDLSSQYTAFVIKFTRKSSSGFDGTYVIANGGYAFSETSGKWMFIDDLSKIVLDSGKEIAVEINHDSLHLEFTVVSSNGRSEGLSGEFVFDLKAL